MGPRQCYLLSLMEKLALMSLCQCIAMYLFSALQVRFWKTASCSIPQLLAQGVGYLCVLCEQVFTGMRQDLQLREPWAA